MLNYQEDFITIEQEQEILKLVPKKEQKGQGRNQVLRYCSKFPYPSNMISTTIPEVFKTLNVPDPFDSVTINEYYHNQWLDFHHDLPSAGNKIVVLSLLNEAIMYFKNKEGQVKQYLLKPRSLAIIEGDLRWNWQHAVKAIQLRYSVVFRNSKEKVNKV